MAGGLSSCSEKKEDEVDQARAFIGKWKLVKITNSITNQSFDYSKNNLVCDFKSNGFLTVTGKNVEEYEIWFLAQVLFRDIYSDEPEFYFKFILDQGIRVYNYRYKVSSKELVIGDVDDSRCDSSVNGYVYYFVKIH